MAQATGEVQASPPTESTRQPLPSSVWKLAAQQQWRYLVLQSGYSSQGLVFPLPFILLAITPWIPKPYDALALAAGIVSLFGGVIASYYIARSWEQATRQLVALNDTRLLAPVLDTFRLHMARDMRAKRKVSLDGRGFMKNAWAEAGQGLSRLLPKVGSEELSSLNARQRRLLHALAVRNIKDYPQDDPGLSMAIIEMLERLGDSRDLPILDRISQQEPGTRSASVIVAAGSAAEALRARLSSEAAEKSLLRAVPPPAEHDQAGQLLRAAQTGEGTNPDHLLRAAQQEPGKSSTSDP